MGYTICLFKEHINFTEDRAVLHTCLRAPLDSEIHPLGDEFIKGVLTDVHEVLGRIKNFSNSIRNGEHRGASGK
jgi:glucose-6-phosphate isomerase